MKQLIAILVVSGFVALPTIYAASQLWDYVETSLAATFDPDTDEKRFSPKD